MHETLAQKFEQLGARVALLEAENQAIKQQREQLGADKEQLQQDNQRLQRENELLRRKVDHYLRYYFGGQRNESLDKHQLELLLQGLPNVVVMPTPESKPAPQRQPGKSHPVRRVLSEDKLETKEVVLEPEEIQAQPQGWKKISEERTEQLEWVPPRIIKNVIVRPRYVKQESFAIAPLPPQPIEQSMATASLLAHILVDKYEYHLPLYRQEKIFAQQFGVQLSRKTMGSWVEQAAELLKPVYRAIRQDLLEGSYLQADETPIRYLDPDVKGKSRKGFLWVYSRPGSDVLFEWRTDRSREGPMEFLKSFRGKLQTDGYAAYESVATQRQGELVLVACWAHVRRGFYEALSESKVAAWFVRQIGLMYWVEKELRQKRAGPKLRQAVRAWQTKPILERLHKAMKLVRQRVLPEGALGQALQYALSRWEALTRFVQDGRLEIDNNWIENAIRPSAVGKKNWLFIGHPTAGERSAVIYTLLGSCRRHRINPFDYLKDLFTRLPAAKISDIKNFTPAAWAKTHRAAQTAQTLAKAA